MRAHPKVDGAVMVIRLPELKCDAVVSAEKDVPLCRFIGLIEGVFSEDRGKVVEVAGRHIAVFVFLVDEHGEGVAEFRLLLIALVCSRVLVLIRPLGPDGKGGMLGMRSSARRLCEFAWVIQPRLGFIKGQLPHDAFYT